MDDAAAPTGPLQLRSSAVAYGAVLRSKRQASGLSQERLGELSGVHPTHVSRMERGLSQPTLETMLRLADVLDASAAGMVREAAAGWAREP